jgi:hypothetical protein
MSQLKYWDGTQWAVAVVGAQGVTGAQGAQGLTGIQGIQGAFILGPSQPSPAYVGEVWVNTNDGRTYVYDGAEWFESYGNYQGLQGPSGLQGIQGPSIAASYDTDQGVISGQVFS